MRRERLFENIKGAFLHMGLFGGASCLNGRASKNRQASTDACLFLSVLCGLFLHAGDFREFVKADL